MKKTIFTLLAGLFALCASAQFRMVGTGSWTSLGGGSYQATITFSNDLTGNSYLPNQIATGFRLVTGTPTSDVLQQYEVTGVSSPTLTQATVTVAQVSPTNSAPAAFSMVYDPTGWNGMIPQVPFGSSGTTAQLQAAVDSYNAKKSLGMLYKADGTGFVNGDTLPAGGIYDGSGQIPPGLIHAEMNIDSTGAEHDAFYLGQFEDPSSGPYGRNDFGFFNDDFNEGSVGIVANKATRNSYTKVYPDAVKTISYPSGSSLPRLTYGGGRYSHSYSNTPGQEIGGSIYSFNSAFRGNGSSAGWLSNNTGTGYAQMLMQYCATSNGFVTTNTNKRVYNVGIGRDSTVNVGNTTLEGISFAYKFPASNPFYVVQRAAGNPTTYFDFISVDLEGTATNSIGFYNNKYYFPNSSPTSNGHTMSWNTNGTFAGWVPSSDGNGIYGGSDTVSHTTKAFFITETGDTIGSLVGVKPDIFPNGSTGGFGFESKNGELISEIKITYDSDGLTMPVMSQGVDENNFMAVYPFGLYNFRGLGNSSNFTFYTIPTGSSRGIKFNKLHGTDANDNFLYYGNDYSSFIKAKPRTIPDVGTVRQIVADSVVNIQLKNEGVNAGTQGQALNYNYTGELVNTTVSGNTATINVTRPYKVYTVLLSQSGTSAPVPIVLENTIGGTMTWSRSGVGEYAVTSSTNAFTADKTVFFRGDIAGAGDATWCRMQWVGENNIGLSSYTDVASFITAELQTDTPLSIEIRVYP